MQTLADITPCFRADGGFIPILVFIIIAIVQVIMKSGKGGEKDNSQSAEEKRRQIEQVREEIRRRIEAQRQQSQGGPAAAQQTSSQAKTIADVTRDPVEAVRYLMEAKRQEEAKKQQARMASAAPARQAAPAPVSTPLEDPVEAIRRRIEGLRESSREAEAKAAAFQQKAEHISSGLHVSRGGEGFSAQGSFRSMLGHPENLRQAMVLTEVLGKPKCLQ